MHSSEQSIVRQLASFFQGRGILAYLVGGYLRDLVLGRSTRDIDLAVRGSAMELARPLADALSGAYVPLDEERDVARVVVPADASAPCTVDLASFSGEVAVDLGRRDFTINALALPLDRAETLDLASEVIDPFDGMEDLRQGRIEVVQERVFSDDLLRLLRAPRLAHQLGFSVTPRTRALIQREAPLRAGEAGERQREELLRLLEPPQALGALTLLDELGLLTVLFPELELGRGVEQPPEHYWDVLHHNLQCVAAMEEVLRQRPPERGRARALALVPWDDELATYFAVEGGDGRSRATLLKLAALFHDVAKPQTKRVEPSGRLRFIGHHTLGAQMVEGMGQRLRLSGRGVRFLSALVEHHLRPGQMAQPGQMPTPRAVYRFFRDAGDAAIGVLYLNLADYLAARGPTLELADWRRHTEVIRFVLAESRREEKRAAPPLVDGHALMRTLSLAPGRQVGQLLAAIWEAQATGEVGTPDEALAMARRLVSELGSGSSAEIELPEAGSV